MLQNLNLQPTYHGQWATIHRYSAQAGLEAPILELNAYTLLSSVIAVRAANVRGERVTSMKAKLETAQGKIEVRFPSRGDEDSTPGSYFRLEFTRKAIRVAVFAEGSAKIHRVLTKVQQALIADNERVRPYIGLVRHDGHNVFENRGSQREPSPTVEQLASLGQVVFGSWDETETPEALELRAVPHPGGKPEIRVELTDIKKGSRK